MLRVTDGEAITRQERREVVILAEHPALTITWSRYAGGERGTDLHVHRRHTDAFYVLEGELTFEVGARADRVVAGPGTFVAVPPDVVHAFTNEGPDEALWLNLHAADCGFADYLRALRDGTVASFDSFDPPADGGRSAAEVLISGPGEGLPAPGGLVKCDRPELRVVEWTGGPPIEAGDDGAVRWRFVHGEGATARVLDARAPR
jgi:quercetin dioxygenase-like cupin family protein